MATSVQVYRSLLDFLALALKEQDFLNKTKSSFYLRQEDNWGLIEFQKSRKSSAEAVVFTINVGVCSKRLLKFFAPDQDAENPSIEDCQWRERLGFLTSHKKDVWWTIDEYTSLQDLALELKNYLCDIAIPLLKKYMQDEHLRDLWCTGKSPGLTEIQRLINLSVLLKALGPSEYLKFITQELICISENKPTAFMVQQHLQSLLDHEP